MSYPSKTLIKSITPVPRTISEANRDAYYACAIQGFRSDVKLTLDFMANAFIGALWVGVTCGLVFSVVYFLFNFGG